MPARRGIFRRRGIQTAKLTRSTTNLQVNGSTVRLAGLNAYWLGLDDNQGGSPGTYPSKIQSAAAFVGMREMGANLVRAHTVGMSAGNTMSFETAPGTFVDANLDAADYAVYQAKLKGIYLMCPLTDNWNFYHGGKWNFVHWAYQQNSSGITDTPGTTKDDTNERQFFDNTTPGLRIRALFKAYISAWLNHFNPYTGLRYKDDPTIAIVETGNEIYAATAEWTQDIAAYIKSIAPDKLVADGSAADRVFISNSPGLNASSVDVLSAHYYPQQQSGSYPPVTFAATNSGYTAGSALDQLSADATNAFNAGKPFLVGEFPWTRSDVSSFYSAVLNNAKVDGAMPWAFIANTDAGAPLTHGGAFGSDDYSIHRPYANSNEQTYAPALARNISAISGVAVSNGAGTDPSTYSLPYTDPFTNSDGASWSSNWTLQSGNNATYTISGNQGRMLTGSANYSGANALLSAATAATTGESVVTFTTSSSTAENYFLMTECADGTGYAANNGYFAEVDIVNGTVSFYQYVGGTRTNLGSSYSIGSAVSGTWRMRLQVAYGTMRMRIWKTSASEPTTWQNSVQVTAGLSGKPGLGYSNGSGTGAMSVLVDDFTYNAATTLASESFTGSDGAAWPSQWTKVTGGTQAGTSTIQSNRGVQNSGSGTTSPNRMTLTGMTSTGEVDLYATLAMAVSGVNQYAELAIDSDASVSGSNWESKNGYWVEIHYSSTAANSSLRLLKAVADTQTQLGSTATLSLTGTTRYAFRLQRIGTTLRVKVWAAGSAEPVAWNISTSATDGFSGKVELLAVSDDVAAVRTASWDDVLVSSVLTV